MLEIINKTYYGNTIGDWVFAIILISVSIIIGRILLWFSSTILKKITKKTETQLDDILIDLIEEPLILIGNLSLVGSSKIAPDFKSGVIILFIGLLDNESSPIKVASIPKPEIKPNINLMPVPELPKSIGFSGFLDSMVRSLMITSFPLINLIKYPTLWLTSPFF